MAAVWLVVVCRPAERLVAGFLDAQTSLQQDAVNHQCVFAVHQMIQTGLWLLTAPKQYSSHAGDCLPILPLC